MMPGVMDFIDIFLVALLMYGLYKLMKSSGALNIFLGVLVFLVIWVLVSYVFKFKLFGSILNKVVNVGAIALIVLFQKEIRHFFIMLGSRKRWQVFYEMFSPQSSSKKETQSYLVQIALACKDLAKQKTGALIVLENMVNLEEYAATGEHIDAEVSSRLIENIFFKNTPLHDGAMLISGQRIKSVACILPVSGNSEIPQQYGLRHRSALGITEVSDAKAIVVSEETGEIAVAYQGKIYGHLMAQDLDRFLKDESMNIPAAGLIKSIKVKRGSKKQQTSSNKEDAKMAKTSEASETQESTGSPKLSKTTEVLESFEKQGYSESSTNEKQLIK